MVPQFVYVPKVKHDLFFIIIFFFLLLHLILILVYILCLFAIHTTHILRILSSCSFFDSFFSQYLSSFLRFFFIYLFFWEEQQQKSSISAAVVVVPSLCINIRYGQNALFAHGQQIHTHIIIVYPHRIYLVKDNYWLVYKKIYYWLML